MFDKRCIIVSLWSHIRIKTDTGLSILDLIILIISDV